MSMVSADNYVVLQGWMLTDLNLKGTDLMVYAIIFGFSQNGDGQCYTGSIQYLIDWTNSSRSTVLRSLASLVEKGYIAKEDRIENGVRFCKYYVQNDIGGVKMTYPSVKMTPGWCQNDTGGGVKMTPNNLDNKKLEDNLAKKTSNKATKFIQPTVEQVEEYCQQMGYGISPDRFVDYYTANGWMTGKTHMKDWKAAVRNWERTRKENKKNNKKGDSLFDQIMNA